MIKTITEEEVLKRVPVALLKRIRAEFKEPALKALLKQSIAERPTDAGQASVRLIQLSGRVPSAADLEAIFPPAQAAAPKDAES